MEAKLFEGESHVSTFAFHEHRERAPHWEQPWQRPRMDRAVAYVNHAATTMNVRSVVDLGCGDGGIVAAIRDLGLDVIGYDFQPSNADGWKERGVDEICFAKNFVEAWWQIPGPDLYVITEVLEHLLDPHEMVRRMHARRAMVVASSPCTETFESHDECHAWAWDIGGYWKMFTDAGFHIIEQTQVGMFQVLLAVPR